MNRKKKTFDEFVGTDIDKEVNDFVDTLFDDEKSIEPEPKQQQAREAFIDDGWVENKECPKCKGVGWVWGHELENGHEDYETDNQYICDDLCHIDIQKQWLKSLGEDMRADDAKRDIELINNLSNEPFDILKTRQNFAINGAIDQENEHLWNPESQTQTMPTSGYDDPYEEQYQFFMANLTENLKPLVSSFLFIDGQDSVTFNIETTFKKKCKALTQCQTDMQTCFEGKDWNSKKIIIEAIKEQS